MSFNTFGKIFRFTTWGESHGPAIGCVIDGCPPNIHISEKDIQKDMDRRRPGQSKFNAEDQLQSRPARHSRWISNLQDRGLVTGFKEKSHDCGHFVAVKTLLLCSSADASVSAAN